MGLGWEFFSYIQMICFILYSWLQFFFSINAKNLFYFVQFGFASDLLMTFASCSAPQVSASCTMEMIFLALQARCGFDLDHGSLYQGPAS
jgi:hypothetical protein